MMSARMALPFSFANVGNPNFFSNTRYGLAKRYPLVACPPAFGSGYRLSSLNQSALGRVLYANRVCVPTSGPVPVTKFGCGGVLGKSTHGLFGVLYESCGSSSDGQ